MKDVIERLREKQRQIESHLATINEVLDRILALDDDAPPVKALPAPKAIATPALRKAAKKELEKRAARVAKPAAAGRGSYAITLDGKEIALPERLHALADLCQSNGSLSKEAALGIFDDDARALQNGAYNLRRRLEPEGWTISLVKDVGYCLARYLP